MIIYFFCRFSVKSVQISRSEMLAVTTSFIECLRYSVLLNVNNQDLSNMLLREQVFILSIFYFIFLYLYCMISTEEILHNLN